MMIRNGKFLTVITILLFTGFACVRVGRLEEDRHTVDRDEAERVTVKLEQGSGEMWIEGGSRRLMEGSFSYNVPRWEPRVHYTEVGRYGTLEVRQRRTSGIPMGDAKNEWRLSLNSRIPMDVEVDLGAGTGDLDFSEVDLRSLTIDMGVGELKLDLTGERSRDLDVRIDGGIGSATIYVPEDIGVRVRVDGGIGSVSAPGFSKTNGRYINASYGESRAGIEIDVDAGIGSIEIRMR